VDFADFHRWTDEQSFSQVLLFVHAELSAGRLSNTHPKDMLSFAKHPKMTRLIHYGRSPKDRLTDGLRGELPSDHPLSSPEKFVGMPYDFGCFVSEHPRMLNIVIEHSFSRPAEPWTKTVWALKRARKEDNGHPGGTLAPSPPRQIGSS